MGAKNSKKKELARNLTRYKLPQQVLQNYGLKVEDVQPLGRVWKLTTATGNKALKKLSCNDVRVVFIYSLLEHMARKGFSRTPRFIRTEYNTPFIRRDNEYYILSDWIEGREVNFKVHSELILAVEELARFHLAAEGMCLEQGTEVLNNWGTWPNKFAERNNDLHQYYYFAQNAEKKGLFHQLYLDHFSHFANQAGIAVELLNKSSYTQLVEDGQLKGIVCHRNYQEENILMNPQGNLHILNFDMAIQDLRIYDLGSLLQRVMIKNKWDFDLSRELIETYEMVNPLATAELEVLLAVLYFPHQIWLCAGRFFKRQRGWSNKELVGQFKNIIGHKKAKEKFLNQFREMVWLRKEEMPYGE